MLNLDRPDFNADSVYRACTRGIQDAAHRALMVACVSHIVDAETEFDQQMNDTTAHLQTTGRGAITTVTVNNLKSLYTAQMLQTKEGRVYYDTIQLSAPYDICPMCGHGFVTTVDHYLPKYRFPLLSVVPLNLLPCCKDCNTGKLIAYPKTPEEQTLHPYYDNIGNDAWLAMEVNRTTPLTVTYFVDPPFDWTDLLADRVRMHFKAFNLEKNYGVLAARLLTSMKRSLVSAFHSRGGEDGVRKILNQMADMHQSFHRNFWQTVLYASLANDNWFCNGGFNNIADPPAGWQQAVI